MQRSGDMTHYLRRISFLHAHPKAAQILARARSYGALLLRAARTSEVPLSRLIPALGCLLLAGFTLIRIVDDYTAALRNAGSIAQSFIRSQAVILETSDRPLALSFAHAKGALPWPTALFLVLDADGDVLFNSRSGASLTVEPMLQSNARPIAATLRLDRAPGGEEFLLATSPVQRSGGSVVLAVPASSILADWRSALGRNIAFFITLLGLATLAAYQQHRIAKRLATAEASRGLAERQLELAENRAGCGDWRIDLTGGQIIWSHSFAALIGEKAGNIWRPLSVIQPMIHPADRAAFRALEENAKSDRAQFVTIIRFLHIEGRYVWLRLLGANEKTNGLVTGLSGVAIDITAMKRQEEALKDSEAALGNSIAELEESRTKLREQTRYLILLAERYAAEKRRAEEASRTKSEFLANMSHELRTPLNAIVGFAEIMKTQMFGALGDPRYRGYAEDIHQAGVELGALITDILDMSEVDSGDRRLEPEPVELKEVVGEVLRLITLRNFESDLRTRVQLEGLPATLADRRAVKQILLNILSNAVKFTPKGGTVTITGKGGDNFVSLSVSDTGIGIAEQDLPRIGQPFVQVENQYNKRYKGSGLGLALAKSLVELHGGTLAVTSKLSEGTTVTVTFPRLSREGAQAIPLRRKPLDAAEHVNSNRKSA